MGHGQHRQDGNGPKLSRARATLRRAIIGAGLLIVIVTAGARPAAQIIDRVLAVVVGEPITLSDVTAALRLGLVPAVAGTADRDQAALNTLIERQLQLIEVNRYVPPEPSDADIDARLAQVRARFESQAALESAMKDTGVTPTLLRARMRDDERIETYLHQRFGGSYQPGEDEIARLLPVARIGVHQKRRAAPVRGRARRGADASRRRSHGLARPRMGRRAAPAGRCDSPAEVKGESSA